MAKEICSNCSVKLTQRVSFCPGCSRPTPHCTESELLDWDLRQWRKHVEDSVASGSIRGTATATRLSVAPARARRPDPAPAPTPDLKVIVAPDPPAKAPRRERRPRASRKLRLPKVAKPSLRLDTRRPAPDEDRVIVLDSDNPFAYSACTSCERADWVVRTTRNEDGTINYWCVRCSRSFKTETVIGRAWKPFLTAGSIVGALTTLSIVMR